MRASAVRVGLSMATTVGSLVLILIIAAGGFLLVDSMGSSSTVASSATSVAGSTSATTSGVPSNEILTGKTDAGFGNGGVVSFSYTQNYTCIPAIAKYATNQTEAAAAAVETSCEVGGGNASAVAGSIPVFVLIPAYAGLSVFGVPALGATSQGFPVYNSSLVFTQCGAGGSGSACFDHPSYLYSPVFTEVEQHLGLKGGYGGLPEGVLPTPAHDHLVDYVGGPSLPWDVIAVLVFDPNIMPNAMTGQCQKVIASDLTNPTGNCLNTFSALGSSLTTDTSATANANATQNNPIYDTLGGVKTQALAIGVATVSDSSPANTNLFLYFNVANGNPIP